MKVRKSKHPGTPREPTALSRRSPESSNVLWGVISDYAIAGQPQPDEATSARISTHTILIHIHTSYMQTRQILAIRQQREEQNPSGMNCGNCKLDYIVVV